MSHYHKLNELKKDIERLRYPYRDNNCPCNGCICEDLSRKVEELIGLVIKISDSIK